jgi:hypothetical protein
MQHEKQTVRLSAWDSSALDTQRQQQVTHFITFSHFDRMATFLSQIGLDARHKGKQQSKQKETNHCVFSRQWI